MFLLLDAFDLLIDFDAMQNSSLLPLSPVISDTPSSTYPWQNTPVQSSDDDECTLTSLITMSKERLHCQTMREDHLALPTTVAPSPPKSSSDDDECTPLTSLITMSKERLHCQTMREDHLALPTTVAPSPPKSSSDDDECTLTSLITMSKERLHCQTMREDHLAPPSTVELSPPKSCSDEDSSSRATDISVGFNVEDFIAASCGADDYSLSSADTRETEENIKVPTKHKQMTTRQKKQGTTKSKTSPSTSKNNLLPPCRICADPASGFHYGVNSCDSCKQFFRRSMKRKRDYKCRGNGRCVIKGQRNNLCGQCRFQQCLALGMSKAAIKTGRYTHAKRAQDWHEIKRLDSDNVQLAIPHAEVSDILRQLMTAHISVRTSANRPKAAMLQQAQAKREEFRLRNDMFPMQTDLTSEQYDQVFRETGIDVDGRKAHMKLLSEALDEFVQGYVRFGTGIPGFSELSTSDQANLLKLGHAEVWLLGAYRGFLVDDDIFCAINGDCRLRHEMDTVLGREYMDNAFNLARALQEMDLSNDEVTVLKAVCLTFTDRCDLEDANQVEAIQWRMLRVLLHLLSHNHPEEPRLSHKVLNWTVGARNHTELARKAISNAHLNLAIRTHAKLACLLLM